MKNYLFFILFCCCCCLACKKDFTQNLKEKETKVAGVQIVKASPLALSTESISIGASGLVSSKAELTLSFKIPGIIERILVTETQLVRKGQLLAAIRSTEVDAQVEKATKALDKARRDLDRTKKMYADTIATLENVEDLTTKTELLKSDLEVAKFNQEYAAIKSPINGRILKKYVESNELVAAGTPVFRLAAQGTQAFVVNVGLTDVDVVRVRIGDRATVTLDAYPTELIEARVTEIAATNDSKTNVYWVELGLDIPKRMTIKKGFIAKVKLYPSKQKPHYKIGIESLVEGYKNKVNVFVPFQTEKSMVAKKVQLVPDYIGADYFTVSADQLEGLDQIVTDGAAYLKDNMPIKIIQ